MPLSKPSGEGGRLSGVGRTLVPVPVPVPVPLAMRDGEFVQVAELGTGRLR